MADQFDVANKFADDINAAVAPLVGTTYAISASAVDAATFGTQTVPNTIVFAGTVTIREVMTRLEQGWASIGVEFDEKDSDTPQYLSGFNYDPALSGAVPIPQVAVATSSGGYTCTFSGGIQAGDVVGVQQGTIAAGYAVQSSDSLVSIATNLAAAAVAAGINAAPSGASVTVSGGAAPTWNVGTSWTQLRESWRRRKMFYATLWAANAYDRSYIGKIIEGLYPPASRPVLPDGTVATVLNFDSVDLDEQQRDMTYIRRVRWMVDFVTIQSVPVTQVVGETVTFTPTAAVSTPSVLVAPTVLQL